MAHTDARGLAVSTGSSEALAAYERGIDLFLRWRSGAPEALDAAVSVDPRFALGHCTRAYVAWRMGKPAIAREAHRQVMALRDSVGTERERLHVEAVDAMERCDTAAAGRGLEQIAEQHPTDRVAVRLLSFACIAQGDYLRGLAFGRKSLEACPGDVQFQTMTGFFLEQSGYNEEGLAISSRALAADPTNLFAYHAVGHAHAARGDYVRAVETFERAASLERYGHIVWHLAEAQAVLGNERLARDYWAGPAMPVFERIELMWRLEVMRHAVVDDATWKDLAAQAEQLLEHGDYLTSWIHHWIGIALARSGQPDKARRQVERLRSLPAGQAGGHWSTAGADLLAGELALMRGDLTEAIALMTPAMELIHRMGGGSREQKDIFRDTYLELHRRLGRADEVIALAQQRLLANPHHLPSLAALAWAYGHTGQTLLERLAHRQLVTRAEEIGLPEQTAELVEARRALATAA